MCVNSIVFSALYRTCEATLGQFIYLVRGVLGIVEDFFVRIGHETTKAFFENMHFYGEYKTRTPICIDIFF